MLRFIVRRLLITIPTILVVISITWVLVKLAPGNFYSGERKLSPAIEKNIREKYGLDKPWYQQYGKTMWTIIRHLDFGTSLKYEGQSVNTIIKRSLPVSAAVGILAYLLALIVGITVGSIAALKQNSKWDYMSMALAMLGISIPNFVLAPILVMIFSLGLYWLLRALDKDVEVIMRDPVPHAYQQLPGANDVRVTPAVDPSYHAVFVIECSDITRPGLADLEK